MKNQTNIIKDLLTFIEWDNQIIDALIKKMGSDFITSDIQLINEKRLKSENDFIESNCSAKQFKNRKRKIDLLNIKVTNYLMLNTNIPVEKLVDVTFDIDKIYKRFLK